jgi:hypothetical protein
MPTIKFECGEKTCHTFKQQETMPTNGKFCRFIRTRNFGQVVFCSLFDDQELRDNNRVLSGEGMLQRLPECLKLEE